jgi:hypothetical protein
MGRGGAQGSQQQLTQHAARFRRLDRYCATMLVTLLSEAPCRALEFFC